MSKKLVLSLAAAAGLLLLVHAARRPAAVVKPPVAGPFPEAGLPEASVVPAPAPTPGAQVRKPERRQDEAAARPGSREERDRASVPAAAAELQVRDAASPLAPLAAQMAPGAAGVTSAAPPVAFALGKEMKKDEHLGSGLAPGYGEFNREAYAHIAENPFLGAASNPLSTFSVDVDTASYANVRRFLNEGRLPPRDAVRIEELLNYFRYDYPEPRAGEAFSISTTSGPCPWSPRHRLALIGLRGRSLDEGSVPPRRLTFLLDVSGSMSSPDKLPLLKRAMGLLVETLREEDQVAIVVYAGAAGVVLPPTSGADRATILAALDRLQAGGSTAGGAGIALAYRVAEASFAAGGINRVILATDGDFNVGVSSEGDLTRLIEEKRKSGVFLSVLGFGTGNLQDSRMEKIADHGNGNYSYIDSLAEARKVLVSEAGGTLVTIAKDVKIQVEFNPARVSAYRLIGYENRALRAEDFADDRKDAGEIGASHTVTALYEIVPVGVPIDLPSVDPLRYQAPSSSTGEHGDELLTVKLRHKDPDGEKSRLRSVAVRDDGDSASTDLRFASAVAEFGMLLRGSEHRGEASWDDVAHLAEGSLGADDSGYRAEFLDLVRLARGLAEPDQLAISR